MGLYGSPQLDNNPVEMIECKRCGTDYPKNWNRCPKCRKGRSSNTITTIIAIITFIGISGVLGVYIGEWTTENKVTHFNVKTNGENAQGEMYTHSNEVTNIKIEDNTKLNTQQKIAIINNKIEDNYREINRIGIDISDINNNVNDINSYMQLTRSMGYGGEVIPQLVIIRDNTIEELNKTMDNLYIATNDAEEMIFRLTRAINNHNNNIGSLADIEKEIENVNVAMEELNEQMENVKNTINNAKENIRVINNSLDKIWEEQERY